MKKIIEFIKKYSDVIEDICYILFIILGIILILLELHLIEDNLWFAMPGYTK